MKRVAAFDEMHRARDLASARRNDDPVENIALFTYVLVGKRRRGRHELVHARPSQEPFARSRRKKCFPSVSLRTVRQAQCADAKRALSDVRGSRAAAIAKHTRRNHPSHDALRCVSCFIVVSVREVRLPIDGVIVRRQRNAARDRTHIRQFREDRHRIFER